jgi:acyl carrier protein
MKDEDLKRDLIERRVCALVAANLCLEPKWVNPTSSFTELGADILDFYLIVIDLEEAFKLSIPNEACRRFVTISDVVDWIISHNEPYRFSLPAYKPHQFDLSARANDPEASQKGKTNGKADGH